MKPELQDLLNLLDLEPIEVGSASMVVRYWVKHW
jgi:hypothetical protein